MYTKYELNKHCKHILDYGENWGFVLVSGEIKWRNSAVKAHQKQIEEYRAELIAFNKLLSRMKERRILKRMLVKKKRKK